MPVITEEHDAVQIVRIDREAKRNAIDRKIAPGTEAALDVLRDGRATRWCADGHRPGLLCGHGSQGRVTARAPSAAVGMIRPRRTKPLVATVEGPALGGGFEIVLACDLVVGSTSAYFGLPEGLRRVLPTSGALIRFRAVPAAQCRARMMLTGEPLTPRAALALGLVNEVTEPGRAVEEAGELAGLVCRSAPTSVTQILHAQQELDAEEDACGWQATAAAVEVVLASEDLREGPLPSSRSGPAVADTVARSAPSCRCGGRSYEVLRGRAFLRAGGLSAPRSLLRSPSMMLSRPSSKSASAAKLVLQYW